LEDHTELFGRANKLLLGDGAFVLDVEKLKDFLEESLFI
jgi:hypothetical protein